ncbi:MAG: NusG domain II-containing protein [Bacillota bacterium]
MLKKGDLILIAIIVVAIAIGLVVVNVLRDANASQPKIAEVLQDSKVLKTFDLKTVSAAQEFKVVGKYTNTVRVENGRIRFVDANCPDKVCVKTGWLTQNGDIAVCLPNHATIKIVGKADKIDIVSY